mgnify:CR=1 FL=1
MNKNLAITILTWNDWENTIECLESIYQSDYNHFDIILIDNNSDKFHLEKIYDWSKNKIKVEDKEFNFNPSKRIDIIKVDENFKIQELGKKKIYLIKNLINIGLTAGLNVGYKFCEEQKYDYIARVDCDFIITKQYFKTMIDTLEKDKKIVAISPKIKHAGLRETVWWAGLKVNWSFLKFHKTMNLKKKRMLHNKNLKGIIDTDAISGCCSVYKGNILKLSGFGDEEFFFGPEDIELSFRLKKFGKLVVNLNSYTLHKIAISSKISGWYRRSYDETIGFLLLIKKIGSFFDKIIGYSYFILRIPFFFILMLINKREKNKVFGFTLGCFDFFFRKKYKRFEE